MIPLVNGYYNYVGPRTMVFLDERQRGAFSFSFLCFFLLFFAFLFCVNISVGPRTMVFYMSMGVGLFFLLVLRPGIKTYLDSFSGHTLI